MASLNKREPLPIATVRELMFEMLAASGLDKQDARIMKCEPLTAAECAKRNVTSFPGAGFTIPYFSAKGKVTKFFRFRYVEDVGAGGVTGLTRKKALRYVQPAGLLPTVYWPVQMPSWPKFFQSDMPLFITEGEKKAACATKNGFATIGLGGVWSFKSKENNVALIEELAELDWTGRRTYIVFDSDAISNRNVLMAETELARQLLDRGAMVYTVRLPDQIDGKKNGLDDFIMDAGSDTLQQLIDSEAEEFNNSKALHDLNNKCTLVLSPPVVWDNANRRIIPTEKFVNHTHAHLKHTICTMVPGKGDDMVPKMTEKRTAKEWILWPGRSAADSLDYIPGAEEILVNDKGRRVINAWDSWGCLPKKGDIAPWRTLISFITDGNTPEQNKWLEQWLAYPLQHPGAKLFQAVVVWSVHQGTGKSFVAHVMSRIYGNNFSEIGTDDLYSTFNSWSANKQFILGEEIAGDENKRVLSDRLKKIITQPDILVNTKYVPQYRIRDCANFYFTSNHPDAFYLEDTDRRFFVQEVRNKPLPLETYRMIDGWMRNGDGPAALFDHLLNVDLTDFNPKGPAPVTRAKEDMRHESKSELGRWVEELQKWGEGKFIVAGKEMDFTLMTTKDLMALYDPEKRKGPITALSKELRRAGMPRAHGGQPIKIGSATHRLWIVGGNRDKLARMTPGQLAKIYLEEHGDGTRKF